MKYRVLPIVGLGFVCLVGAAGVGVFRNRFASDVSPPPAVHAPEQTPKVLMPEPEGDESLPDVDPPDFINAAMQQSIDSSLDGPFAPSLEMSENVDFLLTPGLIVMESMTPDVINGYPED